MTDNNNTTEHPLEDFFDIESNSTPTNVPGVNRETVPAVKRTTELSTSVDHPYDDKDNEIDDQFQEIYDLALEAFGAQSQEAELVEGKYKARNQEIAVQFLNTALNAAANKGTLKNNKEKLAIAAKKVAASAKPGGTTNNNLIVGDRNDILRALRAEREAERNKVVDDQ